MQSRLFVFPFLAAYACADNTFRVTSTTPEQGEPNAVVEVLSAHFSRSLDLTSLGAAQFTVFDGTTPMDGTILSDGSTARWQGAILKPCMAYRVKVSSAVKAQDGTPLGTDYFWAFSKKGDDCTPPITTALPPGGAFKTPQRVSLSCADGAGMGCGRIVYTLDGTVPAFSPPNGTIVAGSSATLDVLAGDTVVRYRGEDLAGNAEATKETLFSVSSSGFTYAGDMAGLYRGIGPNPKTLIAAPSSQLSPNAVFFDQTSKTLYAAGSDGLYRSTDAGVTFFRSTTLDGLGSNDVRGVYALGSLIYVGTAAGIAISTDGGSTFVNKTTADGLGSNEVRSMHALGTLIYAATAAGLAISTDGGNSFVNRAAASGLSSTDLSAAWGDGTTVCAATAAGLAVSTDGGNSFVIRTTADGLGDNHIHGVFCEGNKVYATYSAEQAGVSMSTDQGHSFRNRSTANGLPAFGIKGVYERDEVLYVMTSSGLYISTDGGSTFSGKTTADGLGSNLTTGVYRSEGSLYVADSRDLLDNVDGRPGIAVSTDGGTSFHHHSAASGLQGAPVFGLAVSGSSLYVAAGGFNDNLVFPVGLFISTDGGYSFTVRTVADGLPNPPRGPGYTMNGVAASGSFVYIASSSGLVISTDAGKTFTTRTTAQGLGSNFVWKVRVSGTTVYAATAEGLSISSDGGASFINKTTASGLGSQAVADVCIESSRVYAATSSTLRDPGGISISQDSGSTFANTVIPDGLKLPYSYAHGVAAAGKLVWGATESGLVVSSDGGLTFTYTSPDNSRCVYIANSLVYTCGFDAHGAGLFVSADGGKTFDKKVLGGPDVRVNDVIFVP